MDNNNFYSIDKLVEFGLGIAVAQQMVNSMNHSLQNAHIPGAGNPMTQQRPNYSYHVILKGKPAGPFSEQEMSRMISEGKVTKGTHVWRPGMPKWDLTENVPDVLRLVALAPPPFTPGA